MKGSKTQIRKVGVQNRPLYLFDRWPLVASRLRNAPHLALFLDFDGTLTPLRYRPGDVCLDPPTRTVLRWLARQQNVTVWVISGRRLADVRERVNLSRVGCVGLHGWERRQRSNSQLPRMVRQARRLLADGLSKLPNIWIEEKGPVSVVHYREAPVGVVRRASAIVHDVVRRLEPALRVLPGKDVWEVLPREFEGKGAAVQTLLAELPLGTLPVYVGDDVTDESAFIALPTGLTVRVGPPRLKEAPSMPPPRRNARRAAATFTQARFVLRNPRQVRKFLEWTAEEIRNSRPPQPGARQARRLL